ncbi:MAG TPA: serine protease [Acidimicrobiales bacterium]|nr:serine protease [Acidimicrobiales bacterium]
MVTSRSARRTLTSLLTGALGVVALAAASMPSAAAQAPEGSGDPEIVGGVPVGSVGDFPYQVALVFRAVPSPADGQFCGGTLISPDTVLTAAHCVVDFPATVLDVDSGVRDLAVDPGQRAHVRQIRVHPDYDESTNEADLAILQLASPLAATPIEVAAPEQAGVWPPGTTAAITGWGDLTGAGSVSSIMHVAQIPLVSDADCADAYGPGLIHAETMLCAGNLGIGGVDTCQGDSGGPIAVDNGDTPLQIGITSWGRGCGLPEFPGVYTRVDAFFEPFIKRFLDPDDPPDRARRPTVRLIPGAVRIQWRPPFFDGGTPHHRLKVRILPGGRVFHLGPGARSLDVVLAPGRHTVKLRARNLVGLAVPKTRYVTVPRP